MANHASSTESVEVVPEPINYGASSSSVINQFCANLNVNQEEVMHYTDLGSKTTTELQHPEYSQTSTTFVEDTNYSSPTPNDQTLNYNGYYDRCLSRMDNKLNSIISEQVGIKLLLNRILSKLENNTVINNRQQPLDLDEIFISKFPMNSADDFALVEHHIINYVDFKSKLEYFIKTIGGNTPKNHINRVMAKLFTDKYGIECTWTGRVKNITTKIGESDLIKIIKKTIQESSSSIISAAEFEKVVSEWLRHDNTRYSRQHK